MREFLLLRFVCTRCDQPLEITDIPDEVDEKHQRHKYGEPSERVAGVLGIKPCHCLVREVETMRSAAKTLFEAMPEAANQLTAESCEWVHDPEGILGQGGKSQAASDENSRPLNF